MSRIIFLDLHGVLIPMTNDGAGYSPKCVAAFNRIVEATGADIVLSCNWRGDKTRLSYDLERAGVRGVFVGETRDAFSEREKRYGQIADWLRKPAVRVDRYCILDDDPDAFGGRPGVVVNSSSGLTERDADAAIEILGG